jgi:hypothetical protein
MCNKLINIKISAVQELLISNNLNISNKICSSSFLPAETANNCALFGILERITARKQHFQFVQGVLKFSLIECPEAVKRDLDLISRAISQPVFSLNPIFQVFFLDQTPFLNVQRG